MSYQTCIFLLNRTGYHFLKCALQHTSITSIQLWVNHLPSHCSHCLRISIRIFTRETLSSISVLKYYDFITTKELNSQFSTLSQYFRGSWKISCLCLCIYFLIPKSSVFSSFISINFSSFISKYSSNDFHIAFIFLWWVTQIWNLD